MEAAMRPICEYVKLRTFHIGRLIYTRFRWIREFNQAYVRT